MSEEVKQTIMKQGETVLNFSLHRSPLGITMTVKAHNAVEEFMRRACGSEVSTLAVGAVGRYWEPTKDGKALSVYRLAEKITPEKDADLKWSMDLPGERLIIDPNAEDALGRARPRTADGYTLVNLSFLRLVGISEGAGVTFGIKGVQSLEALQETRNRLGAATRAFYLQYLKPVDLTVGIFTQQMFP